MTLKNSIYLQNHIQMFTVIHKPFHDPLQLPPQQRTGIPSHERPTLALPHLLPVWHTILSIGALTVPFLYLSDLQQSHQNTFDPGIVTYTSNHSSWKVRNKKIRSSRPASALNIYTLNVREQYGSHDIISQKQKGKTKPSIAKMFTFILVICVYVYASIYMSADTQNDQRYQIPLDLEL